jgi:enoyl-CoA hydratase/carnithine racemase
VKDGVIFYLVLNRPKNVFDFETIGLINAALDEVEKSTGAACLVTIGSGDKIFSTGFNLKMWATGVIP